MKKHAILIVCLGVLSLVGCLPLREKAIRLSTEDVANSATLEKVGGNIITAWLAKSGALSAYLGPRLDDVSKKEIKDLMGELDTLADVGKEAATPKQKGEAVGYSARLIKLLGQPISESLLPDIYKFLKSLGV